jgi:hypothetical protein
MITWGMHEGEAAPDLDLIDRLLDEGFNLALKGGRIQAQGLLKDISSWLAFVHGRLSEARDGYEFLSQGEALGYTVWMPETYKLRGLVAATEGNLAAAQEMLDQALAAVGGPTWTVSLRTPWLRGLIAYGNGSDAEAADILEAGAASMPDGPLLDTWDLLLADAAWILARVGRMDAARRWAERLAQMAVGRPAIECLSAWAAGLSNEAVDQRPALLDHAVELFERRRMPYHQARSLVALGHARSQVGLDPGDCLERARALLTGCGALLFMRELDVER